MSRIPDLDELDQPEEEEDRSLFMRLRWLVMVGGLLVAVAVCLVLLGVVPTGAVPAGQVPDSPDEASSAAAACAAVAGGVNITPRNGSLDVQAAGAARFEPVNDVRSLGAGAVVCTGSDGMAVLALAPGASADVYPDTRITFRGITAGEGECVFDVDQASGRVCYVVERDAGLEVRVRMAAGEVVVSDARFCIDEQAGGWCVGVRQGDLAINLDSGESLALNGGGDSGVMVGGPSDGAPCAIEDSLGGNATDEVTEAPEDTPTSTATATATSTPTATATFTPPPTDTPTATNTLTPTPTDEAEDACADHGGLQWEGDTCACSGVTAHVVICEDGTQWTTPTEESCQPDSSCDEGGKKGGGGGGSVCVYGAACTTSLECGGGVCLCAGPCFPPTACCSCDLCPP